MADYPLPLRARVTAAARPVAARALRPVVVRARARVDARVSQLQEHERDLHHATLRRLDELSREMRADNDLLISSLRHGDAEPAAPPQPGQRDLLDRLADATPQDLDPDVLAAVLNIADAHRALRGLADPLSLAADGRLTAVGATVPAAGYVRRALGERAAGDRVLITGPYGGRLAALLADQYDVTLLAATAVAVPPGVRMLVGDLDQLEPGGGHDVVVLAGALERAGLDTEPPADLDGGLAAAAAGQLSPDGDLLVAVRVGSWTVDVEGRRYDRAHLDPLFTGWTTLDASWYAHPDPVTWSRVEGLSAVGTEGLGLLRLGRG